MNFSQLKKLTLAGILVLTACATVKNPEAPKLKLETIVTTEKGDKITRSIEFQNLYDRRKCREYLAIELSEDTIKTPDKRDVKYPIGVIRITDCEKYSRTTFYSDNKEDPYKNAYTEYEGETYQLTRNGNRGSFDVQKIKTEEKRTFMPYAEGLARALIKYTGNKANAKKQIEK